MSVATVAGVAVAAGNNQKNDWPETIRQRLFVVFAVGELGILKKMWQRNSCGFLAGLTVSICWSRIFMGVFLGVLFILCYFFNYIFNILLISSMDAAQSSF
ncbi:MAG: hypothetical protein ACOZF0_20025 [Thermodesulfobacteriota bacterium]